MLQECLTKENQQKIVEGNYRKQDLKRIIRNLNLNRLLKEKNRQVWEMSWFESDDEEDNDSEGIRDQEDSLIYIDKR